MQIKKRDGSLEEFDREKIFRGAVAAGLAEEDATPLALAVEAWAGGVAEGTVASTLEVRNKVLELLREKDSEAAARFEEYKKE